LQTACRNSKKEIYRAKLEVSPKKWVNYLTASRALKIKGEGNPSNLSCKQVFNYYEEPRKPHRGMFSHSSKF